MDITALLSRASHLAQYCTQPEVKFDTFYASNMGKKNEKEFLFLIFHTRTTYTSALSRILSLLCLKRVSQVQYRAKVS